MSEEGKEMKLHPKSRKDILILSTSSQILLVIISPSFL